MKRLGLLALLVVNSSAYSLNIIQGWYGGIMLGLNYTPKTNFAFPSTFDPTASVRSPTGTILPVTALSADVSSLFADLATDPITLQYGTLGQIAGQAGYRCGHFRVEGQFGLNSSPYSSLKINNVSISDSSSTYYTFQGNTDTGFGMINAYYDVLPVDTESNFVPFVGAGIGYAYTQNTLKMNFWNDDGGTVPGYEFATIDAKRTTTSPAGQVMIGGSYFLDDFTAFSLDLRYFTTQKKSDVSDARVEVLSVNLTFNGAFNFG